MQEGAILNVLFSLVTVVSGIKTLPRQPCDPSLSNQTIFDFTLPNVYQNGTIDLSEQRGKLTMFVNPATYCGLVTHYHGFNALMTNYGGEGLDVIGVPCNQFYSEEPSWTGEELMNGLKHVRPGSGFVPNFRLSWKVDVNGRSEHPLFTYMKSVCPSVFDEFFTPISYEPVYVSDVKWTYEKFLVGPDGRPLYRYLHRLEPTDPLIMADINVELAKLQDNSTRDTSSTAPVVG